MKQYLDMLKKVLEEGKTKYPVRQNPNTKKWEPVDGGIKTFACPNIHFSHNMEDGFPLLTTKKMAFKSMCVELEGFIKGITDKRWYQERNCHIWDSWCNPEQTPQEIIYIDKNEQEVRASISGEKATNWQENNPDLGPVYGSIWRDFNKEYKPIPFAYIGMDKTQDIYTDINDNLVGQKFISSRYGQYIVKCIDGKTRTNKTYTIKFYKTNGENYGVTKDEMKQNMVKDVYAPTIYGVACVGHPNKSIVDPKYYANIYDVWRGMIRRCYDVKCKSYKNYGQKNVYVDNHWLIFENFLNDIVFLPNWEYKIKDWNRFSLDKDLCSQKKYGPDTCLWLDNYYQRYLKPIQHKFKAINKQGIIYYSEYLQEFATIFKLRRGSIVDCLNNKRKSYKGWTFQELSKKIDKHDQFSYIVDQLKNNPSDRRMVCLAWNPTKLNQQALPACHIGFIITVIDNKINLHFTQRSADLPIGVPFNIASYGLLLELLAKESGFKAGNLSGIFVDCHIYENQIESVKEQLTRVPTNLPRLTIPDKSSGFSIFDWTYKDVLLQDYHPQSKIKFGEIAV